MGIDLRTQIEKAREEKHKAICDTYASISSEHPECRPYRIMAIVAKQYGMTVPGVKNILMANGLYQASR